MSRASLMAGFEVTLHGRFWVTPEAEAGSRADCKLNCPAWHKPHAWALLETDSVRLLKISAATEMADFQRFLGLAADRDASARFLGQSCAQVFSLVENRADQRISSLSKLH